jgi:hypothetical protein
MRRRTEGSELMRHAGSNGFQAPCGPLAEARHGEGGAAHTRAGARCYRRAGRRRVLPGRWRQHPGCYLPLSSRRGESGGEVAVVGGARIRPRPMTRQRVVAARAMCVLLSTAPVGVRRARRNATHAPCRLPARPRHASRPKTELAPTRRPRRVAAGSLLLPLDRRARLWEALPSERTGSR